MSVCCVHVHRRHFERCYLWPVHIRELALQDIVQLRRGLLVINNLLTLLRFVLDQLQFLNLSTHFRLHHGHIFTADARLNQIFVHSLCCKDALFLYKVVVTDSKVDLGRKPFFLCLGCDVVDGLVKVVIVYTYETDDLRAEEHAGEEIFYLADVGEVVRR